MSNSFQNITDILLQSAQKYSTNIAIIEDTNSTILYNDLLDRCNEYGSYFQKFQIPPQSRIIFYCKKSIDCIAAFFAATKSNLIYVPVSRLNPLERLYQIIDLAGATYIVFDKEDTKNIEYFKAVNEVIHEFDINSLTLLQLAEGNRIEDADKDIAYILFTSGSTGMPKGVSISNHAAFSFISWCAKMFQLNETDKTLSIAPFNFDLSIFDIYVTLYCGATLYICSDDTIKNPMLTAAYIDTEKINTIYATPTFYNTLMQYGKISKYDFSFVRTVLYAGEVFQISGVTQLQQTFNQAQLYNLYGPTETNVCTYFKIPENISQLTVIPIGKACDYANCILVNNINQEITNENIEGEILVSGQSIFSNYWGDTKKSMEAFINLNDVLYYKTGDIAYYDSEMNLVYSHRKDDMVKKNGYRIELNEVEASILNYPSITQVTCLFFKEQNELICFYQTANQEVIDTLVLKLFCANYLPNFMIPDKFVYLDSFPMTVSGKTDKITLKKNYETRAK